jgi:hypothetical protein
VSEIPVLSSVVYPFAETVTLYPPGSRFADIKKPSEFVVTFVVTPVATFVITTEVPGRTPPDESVMVPESVAPATCALDGAEDRSAKITTVARHAAYPAEILRKGIGLPPHLCGGHCTPIAQLTQH